MVELGWGRCASLAFDGTDAPGRIDYCNATITVTWSNLDEPPSKIPVAYPGFHFLGHLTQIIYMYPVGNLSHLLSCPFEVQRMAIFRGRALGVPLRGTA